VIDGKYAWKSLGESLSHDRGLGLLRHLLITSPAERPAGARWDWPRRDRCVHQRACLV
jgi:hypothetical protein